MATGTAKAVSTNQITSDMMCDSESGFHRCRWHFCSPHQFKWLSEPQHRLPDTVQHLLASTTLATTTSPVFTWTIRTSVQT